MATQNDRRVIVERFVRECRHEIRREARLPCMVGDRVRVVLKCNLLFLGREDQDLMKCLQGAFLRHQEYLRIQRSKLPFQSPLRHRFLKIVFPWSRDATTISQQKLSEIL
jgi:hypothetical protein